MSDLAALRAEMDAIAATPVQRQAFETDPPKARAAIAKALSAGARNAAAYAMSVFRQSAIPVKLPTSNLHGAIDPTHTDDGDRIWQWHEVDDSWRRGYLADCWKALEEERDPAARYQPSQLELSALAALAGELEHEPSTLRMTAGKALRAWGMLWFGDPEPER